MKRIHIFILFILLPLTIAAQETISGVIRDNNNEPVPYANIFIKETLEGASSMDDGTFSFTSTATGNVTLTAMSLGYETWSLTAPVSGFKNISIQLKTTSVELDGVVVTAGTFVLKGSSQWKTMGAVDLVTTGGSNGDLYSSINTLPGTQKAGESGRLYIRGGESREAQTYIDDMHVLSPYTTTGSDNTPVRGRYSPFMFDGMTFSLGGYDPEYGQGLSSILPLNTKDESLISKTGINFNTIGGGGGGTKSFENGSASINLDYQNLGPYYKVVPDRTDWIKPYQRISGGTQLRYNPNSKTVAKLYAGYDRTDLSMRETNRDTKLKEDNLYLNTTVRHQTNNGYKLFAGAAYSFIDKDITGGLIANDNNQHKEWELHMKLRMEKRYSQFFKLQAGMESMQRGLNETYITDEKLEGTLDHAINAAFTTTTFSFTEQLSATLSARLENTTSNGEWNILPRVTLNYNFSDIYLSAIAGRYSQLTYNEYLLRDPSLPTESCWHYILGAYHQKNGRVYRVELYDKEYDKLALVTGGKPEATGYGYSRGIDLFFNDTELIRNLEYRFAYSLNFAKRKYRDYPVADVPQFATKHNLSLTLRYNLNALNSIIGITNRFASGRPYHDPNKDGWMNSHAPAYNSLDLSWTWLVNPKLIIFASASNIFNRKHIYNYTWSETPGANGAFAGTPVRSNADQFFFIGVFITLGGNTAYDVSNF